MPRAKLPPGARRKLIKFDAETWQALHSLALDRMNTRHGRADAARIHAIQRESLEPRDMELLLFVGADPSNRS